MQENFGRYIQTKKSAYFLDGWRKFNEDHYNLKSEEFVYEQNGAILSGIVYKDKDGKVVMPASDRYIPLVYVVDENEREFSNYCKRTDLLKKLAAELKRCGIKGTIGFPPGFYDVRPFIWEGFFAEPVYTFVGRLPIDDAQLERNVKRFVKKALQNEYTFEITNDFEKIIYCYEKTRKYKQLTKCIDEEYLYEVSNYLDKTQLLTTLINDKNGEPVSGQIKLVIKDGIVIDWIAGNDRAHINYGINQLCYYQSLKKAEELGAVLFDYCGANDEMVANAKAAWGMELCFGFNISTEKSSIVTMSKRTLKRNRNVKKMMDFIKCR